MVKVKILGQVITSQYGTLKTDDILTTDAAFAKHLVDDCAAAEYVIAAKVAATDPEPVAAEVPAEVARKGKK